MQFFTFELFLSLPDDLHEENPPFTEFKMTGYGRTKMDRLPNGRTDRPSNRYARTHLKNRLLFFLPPFFLLSSLHPSFLSLLIAFILLFFLSTSLFPHPHSSSSSFHFVSPTFLPPFLFALRSSFFLSILPSSQSSSGADLSIFQPHIFNSFVFAAVKETQPRCRAKPRKPRPTRWRPSGRRCSVSKGPRRLPPTTKRLFRYAVIFYHILSLLVIFVAFLWHFFFGFQVCCPF